MDDVIPVNPDAFATYVMLHLKCGHDQDIELLKRAFSVAYDSGWNGVLDRMEYLPAGTELNAAIRTLRAQQVRDDE